MMILNHGAACASEDYLPDDMGAPKKTKPSFRPLSPGMGQAVAERTILRRKPDGDWETWGDVADRVALGNSLLCTDLVEREQEYTSLRNHLRNATTLMSGRHLQHGDATQPTRNLEIFSNCATAAASFIEFYLLLNGSGVGRCYDDDMMLIDWDHAPNLRCVLDESHKDYDYTIHESKRDALHKFGNGPNVLWHEVGDSREGWAKALELWEHGSYERVHASKLLILDFSRVRCKGSPIGGMQDRPASGPGPLMGAFAKAATVKGAGMSRFKQAMYIDHYFAECVLVGGARRAARMATKHWSDPSVFEFITLKRPIEFAGLSVTEVAERRRHGSFPSFLWSSNNSVTVDSEFWELQNGTGERADHARKVFGLIAACAYGDGTGEPGMINQDRLTHNDAGWTDLNRGDYIGSKKYQVEDDTQILLSKLAKRAKKKKYRMITNPCGEISLNLLGGYCVISDVVPYHAETLDEAEEAFRVSARALIRVNTMNSLYPREVRRTNRIGVGITGIHEFAWKFFRCGFRDLLKPDFGTYATLADAGYLFGAGGAMRLPAAVRAAAFWKTLERFSAAIVQEATAYSKKLGLAVPHTMTTIKPAGTTSKLFLLTEGWHLPSHKEFLRYVQFRNDDPLVEVYRAAGYPARRLTSYQGTTIVGFPTAPAITTIGMGDRIVTASEATPEEQFEWLRLGELHWLNGGDKDATYSNQVSYTLKYNPAVVGFDEFRDMLLNNQKTVKCCSVMPQLNDPDAYEYQPEQGITKGEYDALLRHIKTMEQEDVGVEHVSCAGGGCPIDFSSATKH